MGEELKMGKKRAGLEDRTKSENERPECEARRTAAYTKSHLIISISKSNERENRAGA